MKHPQFGFFDDPACLTFETKILQALELPGGRLGVILEHTFFYPTGGGQDNDTGSIGPARVVDVFKDGQPPQVIHVLDRPLPPGPVSARIDSDRRLRHRQHHTAQHLLTQCFVRSLGLDTRSAHISGDTPSTIDLPFTELSQASLDQVEELANRQIYANLPVITRWVAPEKLASIPTRRAPKAQGEIRLVEIQGWDVTPCGGTHCSSTGEIGALKIVKTERQNDNLRVYFAAGLQAYELFRETYQTVSSLAGLLSIHPRELATQVARQLDQIRQSEKELAAMRTTQLDAEAQRLAGQARQVAGRPVVLAGFENRSPGELRLLAARLLDHPALITLLFNRSGAKLTVLTACASGSGCDARALLNHTLAPHNGRGGGDAHMAQGGCTVEPILLEGLMDEFFTNLEVWVLG